MKISTLIVLCAVWTANAQCPCPCTPTPIPTVTPTATASSGLVGAVAEWGVVHPGAPFAAMVGDSIMEGWSGFISRADSGACGAGPCGNTLCDIATVLYATSGNLATGTNDGKNGANMAYIYGKAHNISILPPPKYLIVEGGLNDMRATGATFADRQAYFDQLKTLCDAHGSTLLLEEVWPSITNNAPATSIAAWNIALNTWANVNGATVIHTHDWMADPTDNTKILGAWTIDHTHPSQAGVARHADAIYNILLQLEGQ